MEFIQDPVFPLESLIQQSDWETIVRTINENPNAARTKQKVGDRLQFPIYTLLKGGAPSNVIDSVLGSNENIFNVDGHYCEDPLRLAIATKDLLIVKSVLTYILKQGPLRGDNILHFALEQVGTPEEIIAELLERFPDSPHEINISSSCRYPIEVALKNGYSQAILNLVSIKDSSIYVDMLNPALENPSLNPEVFANILRLSMEKYNSFNRAPVALQAPMAGRHGLQPMNPLGGYPPIAYTVENNPVSNMFCTALTTALSKCASMSIFRLLIASDLCREVLRVPRHRDSLLRAFITHSGDSALYRAHNEEGLSVLQDFVEHVHSMDSQRQFSMGLNASNAISCNSPLLRCFVTSSNCQEVHQIEVRRKGGDLYKYKRIFLHIALSAAVVTAQTVQTLVNAWPSALLIDELCSRNQNKGSDPARSVWDLVAPHPNSVLLAMVQGLQKLMGQYDLSASFGKAACQLVYRLGFITNDTTQEEILMLTSHLEYCIAHNPSALARERCLHRFVQYCSAEAVRAVLKDNNCVMKTDNQGCLCLHGVLHRPEIVQALLEAGSADEQRKFLLNCKLPFHPAPHKQVTAVEMAVAASAPLQVVELLVHDQVQNVLCSLAISNKAPDEVCLFLVQRYPDEVNAQLLSTALHKKCSDSIIVALLNALIGTLHKATFTTEQHPVLLVLLAGHYAESTVDQVLAEFGAKCVNASLVTVAMRHKCSERDLLRLLALTRSSPTGVSSRSLSPTPEGAEALQHPLLLALSHGLDNIFYSVDTLRALMTQFPGGAAQSCVFFHGVTDSPLAFALRLGYSVEVLNLLISEYTAAVVAMVPSRTKRPVPLWERALRDSESSQDRTKDLSSTERTKPDIDMSSEEGREHLRILATSSAGVALLCLKALELELATNKRLFVHIMAMVELTSFTASMIAKGWFRRRPDLKYLCLEAAEKTPRTKTRDVLHTYVFFCGRYQQTIGAPLHRSATAVVVEFSDHEVIKEYEQSYHVYADTGGDLVKALATIHMQASQEAVKQLQTFAEEDAAAVVSSEDASPVSPGSPVTDPPSSKLIGQQAYETFCVEKFGRTRKVVIKFMRDKVQYDREIQTREKQRLEEQYVVPLLRRGPGAEQLAEEMKKDLEDKRGIRHVEPAFHFGLIMPAADRSVEAIFLSERPDVNEVRVYMRQIGEALSHCHQHGIVHGDLKMLNVIRVGGLLRLIDLDASAPLLRGSKLGAKFSSGVLPPEMFARLDETGVAKFDAYWDEEKVRNTELWQKIAPRAIVATGATKSYVVKTFNGNAAVRPLPYKLQDASPAADYWAYGLLLYRFLSGEHLLSVNRDDDLVGAAEYQQAMAWSPEEIQAQLAPLLEKNYHTAVELLTCLLQPSAQKREEKSLTFLLQNSLFFKEDEKTEEKKDAVSLQILASIEDLRRTKNSEMAVLLELRARSERIERQTQRLPEMSATLIKRMNRMEKVMLKAVVEAADVVTPSCFLIVDQKILEDGEKPKDATQRDAMVEKATSWVANLGKIAGAVSQVMSKDGREKMIREAFDSILQSRSLYLYLVDEYTLLPIVSYTHVDLPEYPFEIKMGSKDAQKMIAKMMPLLQAGLTAMSIANSALSLARCLGYPVPVLSKELQDQAAAAVDKLNKKSNVEQYSLLQDALDKYGENADGESAGDAASSVEQNKSVRGAPLREFARYLGEKDPLCKFAGLQRYAADNGLVTWLTDESLRKVSEEAQREEEEEETSLHMLTKKLDAVDIAAKEPPVPPPLPIAVVPVAPTAQHVVQTQMQVDSARTLQELAMLQAELARLQQVNSQQLQVISEQNSTITSMHTTIAAQNASLGGLQTTVSSQHAVIKEQASNLCLLGEAVPKSLNAMRTDIVASVELAAQPGAKKK